MSLSLREFRPRCDEVRRFAAIILNSPFSIFNYSTRYA